MNSDLNPAQLVSLATSMANEYALEAERARLRAVAFSAAGKTHEAEFETDKQDLFNTMRAAVADEAGKAISAAESAGFTVTIRNDNSVVCEKVVEEPE